MENAHLPRRLTELFNEGAASETAKFPRTEVFNEGWMLRLVLDAFKRLDVKDGPFRFQDGSDWASEARLPSRFRPRMKADPLGEGPTNADGVVGHFEFRRNTKAGVSLRRDARQFVVVEAKMLSNFSNGVRNARGYGQAARNVACMAETIATVESRLETISDIGFYVFAPERADRRPKTNLEERMTPASIRNGVEDRIQAYVSAGRDEASELFDWLKSDFEPLLSRLEETRTLKVVSWDECIDAIGGVHAQTADELRTYYKNCLDLAVTKRA